MASDVRKRRAERARQTRMREAPKKLLKYGVLGAGVVAIGGALAYLVITNPGLAFAHEHAAFAMFVDGERVRFDSPEYDFSRFNEGFHMHSGETNYGSIWHIEDTFRGGTPDLPLSRYFGAWGFTFRQGFVRLDTNAGHNGSEYPDSGNRTWKLYTAFYTGFGWGNWTRVEGDYSKFVPRDGDKLLITHGNDDEAVINAQQDNVPDLPAGLRPPKPPRGTATQA